MDPNTGRTTADLRGLFADPPREFGMMPFWFWNDDLDEGELLRQIQAFYDKGFGGFIPHARVGLSRRVGYLTDEHFRLVRVCVEEAKRLGMKVVLYDEGSYPSGSAQGRVVAANPAHAARCLIQVSRDVDGPASGYWRPNPGRALCDELLCVVLAKETEPGVLDADSLALLEADAHEVVRYDVGEGRWRLISIWSVFSGGTIRGVFAEEEDGHALAPAAGDLLNPDAVASFLRFTHDAYYRHLQAHFGDTVVAMFTDEPSPMGRGPRRGPKPVPYTDGLLADVEALWGEDPRRWLPGLWFDLGPRTAAARQTYRRAVYERLARVFYSGQRNWCAEHGIALTGHPGESNEFTALRLFHWPGQDMVWRYVEPAKPTALEGPHSIAPRGAASAAALDGRPRNASEVLGAYGWNLTLDEAKWLFDWHLVRGNNLFFAHACFYSIRGRRAYESEPDLGVHNVWWPYFGAVGDYVRRVSWALSGGSEVNRVAVLTDPDDMAWRAAKALYRSQIGFVYADPPALAAATVEDGSLRVGGQRFAAVVVDPPELAESPLPAVLTAFERAGGLVLREWDEEALPGVLTAAIGRDVHWDGSPDLRVLQYRKGDLRLFLLVNEGEEAIEGALSLGDVGALELWNPLDGSCRPWAARAEAGRTHTHLRLERRQGLILALDAGTPPRADVPPAPLPGDVVARIGSPWQVEDEAGSAVGVPCPGDWAQVAGWETFSGTLTCLTSFPLSDEAATRARFLDLGAVGDIAEVHLNGRRLGVRCWAPYVLSIDGAARAGDNALEVRVTNGMANAMEGLQRPSGLLSAPVLRDVQG